MPARVAPNLDAVRGSMDFDVIVLGAGIVGVSSALHLQDRGLRSRSSTGARPARKPATVMPG